MGDAFITRSIGGLNTATFGKIKVLRTEIFNTNTTFYAPMLLVDNQISVRVFGGGGGGGGGVNAN